MTAAKTILEELTRLGNAGYKRVLLNHGIREPLLGVKIAELKKIQKRIKTQYQLALDLYDTGVYDARYLAGLIADEEKMTKKDLVRWVSGANCASLFEYTVPWVAAESRHGHELALKWIESAKEGVASAGWATLSCIVSITEDSNLDLAELNKLLDRVRKTIHQQPNRVRYVMNGFVAAVGIHVRALTEEALRAAAAMGPVSVDMDGTACKVPDAPSHIKKAKQRGALGKKRKSVRC
jgi:3-methyladenine DNA glycosylase AlkD